MTGESRSDRDVERRTRAAELTAGWRVGGGLPANHGLRIAGRGECRHRSPAAGDGGRREPDGHGLEARRDWLVALRDGPSSRRGRHRPGMAGADRQLHRESGRKTLRRSFSGGRVRSRFLQEAITGQLEHPGIVPVMNSSPPRGPARLSTACVSCSRTLAQAPSYHQGGGQAKQTLGLVSLLSAFVAVCNTVAYTHSRGVIHRTSKGKTCSWVISARCWCSTGAWPRCSAIRRTRQHASRHAVLVGGRHAALQGDIRARRPTFEQAEGRLDLIDHRGTSTAQRDSLRDSHGTAAVHRSSTVEVLEKLVRDAPTHPRAVARCAPHVQAACPAPSRHRPSPHRHAGLKSDPAGSAAAGRGGDAAAANDRPSRLPERPLGLGPRPTRSSSRRWKSIRPIDTNANHLDSGRNGSTRRAGPRLGRQLRTSTATSHYE